MSASRVACVLPALDAADTVSEVTSGLRAAVDRVFIIGVDDGSADGTLAAMRQSCDEVISFARNRGKGAALRAGFAAALSIECDVVLCLDADGQHDPLYAPALVAALQGADVVIGSRDVVGSAMPIHRRMTNALSNAAVAACSGVRLPDTQSGYRAARAAVVREVLPSGDRYEFETEFLLLAARRGFRFATVSVPSIYPRDGTSHFRLGRDATRIARTFWRYRSGAAH